MKKIINFSAIIKIFALAVSMLAVSSPVFEQIVQGKINDEIASKDHESKKDKNDGDKLILPDIQATISSYHLDLDNVPKIQPVVPVPSLSRNEMFQVLSLTSYPFFKTLFRNIISPNAP